MMNVRKYIVGFLILGHALPALAEDTAICVRNQYIMAEKVPALRQKAETALEDASGEKFGLVDIQEKTGLFVLETASDLTKGVNDADDSVQVSKSKNACEKFRKKRRKARTESFSANSTNISSLRNYECECNAVIEASNTTPNDPYYSSHLWGMKDFNPTQGLYGIGATAAWDKTTGNSSTVIAIIDTGIDYNHPDLAGNLWVNSAEVAGNGLDDDANGYVDDVYGINSINSSGNPMDDHGHGTHCAGTIGGRGNNSQGVVGVNWNIKMIGVKFLNSSGSGSLYDAMESIDYVTSLKQRGVNVILSNNSWGGGGYSQFLLDSIRRARDQGVLFVAAAGNNTNNNDASPSYPASYDVENVIAVAAVGPAGSLASFSNYGATSVDLGAPGVSISSTLPNNSYAAWSGTSMATPHVSGALALLYAWNPSLSWSQLKTILLQTTVPLASLNGRVANSAYLNVNAMLNAAYLPGQTPIPTATSTFTPTPRPSNTPTAIPSSTPTRTPTMTPTPGYYRLSGTVKREGDNFVVPGAKVVIKYGSNQTTLYTDAQGRYSLSNILGPITYTVSVTASGYTFDTNTVYLSGDRTLDFSGLFNAYTLSGRVINDDKEGLANVKINLNESTSVTTDSQGNFSFNVPLNYEYNLLAEASQYSFNMTELKGTVRGDTKRIFLGRYKY